MSLTGHSGKIHENIGAHEIPFGKSKDLGGEGVSLRVTLTCFLKVG
jgi:hypothetical protein